MVATKFKHIAVTQAGQDGNVYIISLQKPPENRLNVEACQEIIRALRETESILGPDAAGAVILTSSFPKFFTTGLDLTERLSNKFSSSDGFYPLLHALLDYPFPTVCAITGHVFGGACLLTLACDYRVMNASRGFWSMPPVNAGLHHDGMGSLVRLKLGPQVARRVLLEGHRFTGREARECGIVDWVEDSQEGLMGRAMEVAEGVKGKAKMGVYGLLRSELWGEAGEYYARNSYVHRKETAREPKVML